MLTLVQNFYVPFMREFLLLHGVCNCDRKTCLNLLSKCTPPPLSYGHLPGLPCHLPIHPMAWLHWDMGLRLCTST